MKQGTKQIMGLVLVSLLSSGATIGLYSLYTNSDTSKDQRSIENYSQPVSFTSTSKTPAFQTDFTDAAERTINSVVHIQSTINQTTVSRGGQRDPFFDFFFGDRGGYQMPQQKPQKGFGSGVIISSDGYIVTNNHVIDRSDEILVTLDNKKSYPAKLIGTDPSTDIALIKIEAEGLTAIPFGDSDKIKIGEWVLAVGNPFNLTSTVTAGIVSAKARNINILANAGPMRIESFIQTDAAVNPGNSGGALVNIRGELVGINTAIASETGNFAGYSFAVPINMASKIVTDLKQYGSVQRAVLGVQIGDINSEMQKELNLATLDGVYIGGVVERGSAASAGIEKGDIITAINEHPTKSVSELQEQVSRYRPGDKVKVDYIRGKDKKSASVTLKNQQGNTEIVKQLGIGNLGATFQPVPNDLKAQLGIRSGLQVKDIDSKGKFAKAQIRKGFILLQINNQRINSVQDLESIIKEIRQGSANEQGMFIMGVYPSGKTAYYAINLAE